jgi:hypothetical protein
MTYTPSWKRILDDFHYAKSPGGAGASSDKHLMRLKTAEAGAEALGVEVDHTPGALSKALNYLDRPKSVVVGGLSGLMGLDDGDGDDTNDGMFSRIGQAATGRSYGAGDFGALQVDDDDTFGLKALKLGGAFAMDVAADPLTYVGGAGIAKRAVVEGAGVSGKRVAAKLSDDALDALARRADPNLLEGLVSKHADDLLAKQTADEGAEMARNATRDLTPGEWVQATDRGNFGTVLGTEGDTVLVGFGEGGRKTVRLSREAVRPTTRAGGDEIARKVGFDDLDPTKRRDIGEAALMDSLASAASRGGRVGLRREIDRIAAETGQSAEELWALLPKDVQGGLGVRVPFGKFKQLPGSGGGQLTEKLLGERGLDALEAGVRARNKARELPVAKGFNRNLTGAMGRTYDEFVRTLDADEGRTSFVDYYQLKTGREAAALLANAKGREITESLASVEDLLKRDDIDDKLARNLSEKIFEDLWQNNPLDAYDTDSPAVQAAVARAKVAFETVQQMRVWANENGVPIEELENFTGPHVMTRSERMRRAKQSAQRTGDYDPTKSGGQYLHADELLDDDAARVRMSAREANEASGRKVFETDPIVTAAAYADGVIRAARKHKTLETIANLPSVRGAETRIAKVIDRTQLREATAKGVGAFRILAEAAESDPRKAEELANLLVSSEVLRDLALQLDEAPSPDEAVLGGFLEMLGQSIRGLTPEQRKLLGDSDELFATARGRGLVDEQKRLVLGEGFEALTAFRGGGVTMPDEWANLYGPEVIARMAQSMAEVKKDPTEAIRFFDDVWRPLTTTWKQYVTVGRGPGYGVRNVIGGTWNAYVSGAQASDFKIAAQVMKAERDALAQARREITGLDELDARFAGLSEVVRPQGNEAAIRARTEELLKDKLSRVRVSDDATAWDLVQEFDARDLTGTAKTAEDATSAARSGRLTESLAGEASNPLFPDRDAETLRWWMKGLNSATDNGVMRFARKYNSEIPERYLRLGSFAAGVRRNGFDEAGREMAVQFVKATQFDYSTEALSESEKALRSWLVPFYGWTRNNVPLQLRQLVANPGKVANAVKFHETLKELIGADEQPEVLPQFVEEKLGFVTGLTLPGHDAPLALNMEAPVTELNNFFKGNGLPDRDALMGMSHPLLKGGYTAMTGVDTFTKEQIEGQEQAPGWLPGWLPGVSRSPEGEAKWNRGIATAIDQGLPPLAQALRLTGAGKHRERLGSNLLSQLAGVPVTTATQRQLDGATKSRYEAIEGDLEPIAFELGIDPRELRELLRQGYSPEFLRERLTGR